MRIAVVNNFFPPRVGGSSHLSESLAMSYAAAGHEVLVVTAAFGDAPGEELRDGLRIVRLPAWKMPRLGLSIDFNLTFAVGPRNLRRLFRLFDDFRPDVIHQHGQFFDLTWMSGIYARRRDVPTLLSVHTRLESPQRAYDGLFRILDRILVRPVLSVYGPTLVVMDVHMDRYIRARYCVPPHRLVAIPVGVETRRFAGANAERVRAELDIDARPMILSIGHVIPLRDRVLLAEAMPKVIANVPDIVLVVVGNVHYSRFVDVLRERGVDDRHVVCSGAVPKDRVPDYLAACQVETHDLQGHGLGTATLESMAAGVPVVAAVVEDNFPGITLRNWEDLVLVPVGDAEALADALTHLLASPEVSARIGASGRDLVKKEFSIKHVAARHVDVLTRLAARGRE